MIEEMSDELQMLRETCAEMARKEFAPKAHIWDEEERSPLENLPTLARAGLAGVTIAEEHGGSGGSVFHAVIAVEEIARACPPTAGFILGNAVTNEMLSLFGTPEHREEWLPQIAAGTKLSAWAMTEPEAGSAATELQTRAVRDGGGYRLTGQKVFITRATVADVFVAFARVDNVPGAKGVAAFLVRADTEGVSLGSPERHMGFRGGGSAEVLFDGAFVSDRDLLVGPGGFGKLMRGLNIARVLNPTFCLGIAREALARALVYTQERRQFGKDLASFQGVQWMLADMHVKVEAMRLLIYRAATAIARGLPDAPLLAATAKTFANENGFQVVDTALQLHGGYGYSRDFPIERMFRDIRGFQWAGGSTQTLRNTIASQIIGRRIDQRA